RISEALRDRSSRHIRQGRRCSKNVADKKRNARSRRILGTARHSSISGYGGTRSRAAPNSKFRNEHIRSWQGALRLPYRIAQTRHRRECPKIFPTRSAL